MRRAGMSIVSLLLSLAVGVLWFASVRSEPVAGDRLAAPPFGPGEKLTYAITYLGMRAGTAVMEVQDVEPVEAHPALRLLTVAKSMPPSASSTPSTIASNHWSMPRR